MEDVIRLGEITCPSGDLVLIDGGNLGLWSGDRSPDETREPDEPLAVDFEIIGPDADMAARAFRPRSRRMLYDIPQRDAAEFAASFVEHCRDHGLRASLRPFERQVPHRERARRAITGGDPHFEITGMAVVAVGGLPVGRELEVTAAAGEWGWRHLRISTGGGPTVQTVTLGSIDVDHARFAFADADALSYWVHDRPIDGLADIVFWGADEERVAAEVGAPRTSMSGDDVYGWRNLPVQAAHEKAMALRELRDTGEWLFTFDLRPHSHHWQVMAGVRASEEEAATIDVAGARILFAMTTVGDGGFPVHVELDADGGSVAIQITVSSSAP
jgi:hypothetical protein